MKPSRKTRGQASEKRGRWAEILALLLLVAKGYRILGRRVKTRAGEIDLIARSLSGIVCFVEVKARPDEATLFEAVTARQQGRILRAAELYLAGRAMRYRFDIISVLPGRLPRHRRGAFRAEDVL